MRHCEPEGRGNLLVLEGLLLRLLAARNDSFRNGEKKMKIHKIKERVVLKFQKGKLERQVIEFAYYIVTALESGVGLTQAIYMASDDFDKPIKKHLLLMKQGLKVGRSVEEVCSEFADNTKTEESYLVSQAIWGLRKSGGNLVGVFKSLADSAVERQRTREKARMITYQVRSEGVLLSTFPFLLGVALEIVFPGYLKPLFADKLGLTICIISISWLCIGILLLFKMGKVNV